MESLAADESVINVGNTEGQEIIGKSEGFEIVKFFTFSQPTLNTFCMESINLG